MVSTAFFAQVCMKLWWLWDNSSDMFLHFNYNFFTLLQKTLYLNCGNSWHCSTPSSPYVLLTQINKNIVARSVPFIFIFYLYWDFIYVQWTWGSSPSLDTLVFSVWLRSVIHSTHPCVLFALPIWPRSTSLVQSSVSKNRYGYPGFEDFGFLNHFARFRNAEIVTWCYLFIY